MCLYGRTRVCGIRLQTAAENLIAAVNSQTAVSFAAAAYKQVSQILVPSGRHHQAGRYHLLLSNIYHPRGFLSVAHLIHGQGWS